MSESKYKMVELAFILFIIILGFYYIYLAFNTQMLGEDEASYFSLAKDFMKFEYKQDPYVVIPLVSLFYVPFFYLLGASLGLAKAVIAMFGILTIIMIYLFCKKLDKTTFFGINIFGLASISILLTISYFTHFMLISYTEIPIAFFSILFLYLLLDFNDMKKAVFLGFVIGLSFYMKTSALIFPIVLFIFSAVKYFIKKDKRFFKLSLISCIIFAAFIIPFALRNIILFNYPFIDGLNSFFAIPSNLIPAWNSAEITRALSLSVNLFDVFGYVALFLSIFGIVYAFESKNEKIFFATFMFLLFVLIFYVRNFFGAGISDPRYFSVVFPEIALIGGYYIGKVVGIKKYLPIILIIFLVFAVYSSITIALSTEQSQRYPNDYINALKWFKQNTNKNNVVFTAYGGSLSYYGERKNIWATSIDEFPELMHSTDSTYIYSTMKKYNVSYILVWRGVLSSDWIIPQSNIIGVFTYNFVTQVDGDKQHFNMTYSNTNSQGQTDNFIFKVL